MAQFYFNGKFLQGNFQPKKVNLAFVFQLNCRGSFEFGFPMVNGLFEKWGDKVGFIGISTAFDNFELNSEANTRMFLEKGKEVNNCKPHLNGAINVTFPVVYDHLTNHADFIANEQNILTISRFNSNFPILPEWEKEVIVEQVRSRYGQFPEIAETAVLNQLKGSPSFVIFNEHNLILQKLFGYQEEEVLEILIKNYLG